MQASFALKFEWMNTLYERKCMETLLHWALQQRPNVHSNLTTNYALIKIHSLFIHSKIYIELDIATKAQRS